MSACTSFEADLVAAPLGLLEDDRADSIAQHLESCARCRALQAALQGELEACLRLPDDAVPETVWSKVAGQVEVAQARSQLRIVLGCTFCHDDLPRAEAAYCATCLAPHHADCFSQHGRCSTPGCGDTQVVQSKDVKQLKPLKPWDERLRGLAIGAALLLGVAAAFSTQTVQSALFGDDPPVIAVDWPEQRWVQRGQNGKVKVHVQRVMLKRVMDEFSAKTGIKVDWDRKLDGPVSLNIPYSSPREALELIAKRVGAPLKELEDGSFTLIRPQRIDAVYEGVDVREAMQDLAGRSGFTIIMDPSFKGEVTCDLRNVHPLQAISAITRTLGEFALVEEADHLLRIVPESSIEQQLQEHVYPLRTLSRRDAEALLPTLKDALPSDVEGCSVRYLPDKHAYVLVATKPVLVKLMRTMDRADGAKKKKRKK